MFLTIRFEQLERRLFISRSGHVFDHAYAGSSGHSGNSSCSTIWSRGSTLCPASNIKLEVDCRVAADTDLCSRPARAAR